MPARTVATALLLATSLPMLAAADPLTRTIQQDLAALGYQPGATNGESTLETTIAISKFQAENGLAIDGEPSPQLAGVIKARLDAGDATGAAPAAAADPAALEAARRACIEDKLAEARASQKKKRGLGSLMRAVTRTAGRFGSNEVAQSVSRTARDVYSVDATASDLESAARDLGLTSDDLEACRNPAP